MLCVNVTSSTVDHGEPPLWLRGVNTMANPSWSPCFQLSSKTLPSISTRRAFFSSKRFLTTQGVRAYVGSPMRHDSGRAKRFPRISMSDATRFGIVGSAPPNMTPIPAPSR